MAEISNLKQKALDGVFWSYVSNFGTQILSIIPAMVLARLISPEEYGLVAMAAVFSGIAYILSDGGFGNALYQKKDADHLDYCSVFYFNIVVCTFTYCIFFFLAPYCAAFFKMPQVTNIMRVSLLCLIINAFSGIHGIIFKKNLNFKTPAYRNIISQGAAAIIAIVLAFKGFGYWTLVIQGLLQTLFGCIINWLSRDWTPTLSFSFKRLSGMIGYGSKVYLIMIIDYAFNKAYDVTIGKFYSASSLSFYNRAYSTAGIFLGTFTGVMQSVSFPSFVQIQDDKERTRINADRLIQLACFFIFPVMLSLIAIAEPIFHFLYSSKWDSAIPLFRLVCIWALFKPITDALNGVIMASGYASVGLFNSIFSKILIVATIASTWNFGISYMIGGQIVAIIIQVFYYSYFSNNFFNYSFVDIVKSIYKYLIIGIIIAFCIFIFDNMLSYFLHQFNFIEYLESGIRTILDIIFCICIFVYINKKAKSEALCLLVSLLSERRNKYTNLIIKYLT